MRRTRIKPGEAAKKIFMLGGINVFYLGVKVLIL
jgi:hypothetical protein